MAFKLFHVSGKIILEKFEAKADVAANLVRSFPELPARFFRNEEFVSH